MKKCPKCGYEGESQFCVKCGTLMEEIPVEKVCPVCGNKTAAKFCDNCGHDMSKDIVQTVTEDKEAKKPLDKKLLIIIGLIIVIIALAVVIVLRPNSANPSSDVVTDFTSDDDGAFNISENDKMKLLESSWYYEDGYVNYFVSVKNASDSKTLRGGEVKITAYDSDEGVLNTVDITLGEIKAGDTYCETGLAYDTNSKPARVDFELVEPDEYSWIDDSESNYPGLKPIKTKDIKIIPDEYTPRLTGRLINDNDYAIKDASISVVLRKDGKIIYSRSDYADSQKANSETPFSVDLFDLKNTSDDYDIEIYVNPW